MVRRAAAWLLCLLLAVSVILSCAAAESAGGKVVRVGWYESSFNRTESNGRRSGYAYEYQMKVAAYTGWRYEYVNGSWSDLLQMLKDGEIDLMSDVSYTEERAEEILFCEIPMGAEEYYLFISPDNREISSSDYATLNGKKVGVNRDSVQAGFYREWAVQHGVESELIELTSSESQSIRMLHDGELDAYVTVDSFADADAKPVPVFKIGSSDFYFAVSKDRPDLQQELETAMHLIREENPNYNQELTDKHLVTVGSNAFLTVDEANWLAHHGPIRVGYQDNYLAFCATDPETGELTGVLKDYLESGSDCFANGHIDFETKGYPTAAAAMEAMQNGEVDCVFPANLNAWDGERMGLVMTPPLMRTDIIAIVRQADRHLFTSREHVIVAVNEGNPNYDSCLQNDFPSWLAVYYPTTEDCLRMVSEGVADCVLVSGFRYNNIARLCKRLHLSTVATTSEMDYCFAVNAGETRLYSILSKMTKLVPNTAVNTAMSRYITEDAKTTVGDFLSEYSAVLTALAGAVLLVIFALLVRSRKAEKKAAALISATETDELTGLYNRDYFLEYAARLHREHPEALRDAIVMNIDRFHSVNALNGRAFGNEVLRTLGGEIRAVAAETGGIAGRFEADRFDLFIPHTEDYPALYERLQGKLDALSSAIPIRLRMGVMPGQGDTEPVQMFDRARTACSMARNNYKEHLVVFDESMRERENYEQRLLGDLNRALNSYEFEVYYQPQYDIRFDPPRLVGAEALVRWNHPELGQLTPNDFVPLLERSGKIGEMDQYVWSETARQIAQWRDQYGMTIPVSVNLSRMDVFDPALESALVRLMAYHELEEGTLRMEVTESAYTENANEVIRVVESLRHKGFIVEMDDFGTGYSSLNMLSAMPVDVLKMDRAFIRNIGESEKDAHLVALILGIAKDMKIPVVAEGVETEEQLQILKKLGCTLVQGFWFSRPLPADRFEEEILLPSLSSQKKTAADESADDR